MTSPRNSVLPPGPKSHWLLGTGVMQVKDPLGQLIRAQQRYGDIVYFNMFEGPTWLLCHPDQAQHVLADNFSNYPAMGGDGPDLLLGRGLFVSRGDYWRRQRRMVQPAFHPQRLTRMVEGMVRELHLQAERWAPHVSNGEPVELLSQMRRLVLGMLGISIFSSNIYELHAPLRESIDFFTQEIHGPRDSLLKNVIALLRLRRAPMERFFAAVERLNTVLYGLIAERRQAPEGKDDVMTMLLEARDTQGVAMTDTEVRDELVSLFINGYEATAVALTWIWYELARHPEVEQRVRDELASVLGGQAPTAENLQALQYTRAVVEEVMRLHPPPWQFMRRAVQEDKLGAWTIPPGTAVLISPYLLHRHPAFWEQPERLIPERFLPEQKEARHRYAYLPFGGGQRLCIGKGYALTLLTLSVATLLQRYQLRLAPNYRLVPTACSTHRPRHGVMATLHPAPPAA